MAEEILFQSDYVTITPTVARFGNTSYQISNIGSVTVQFRCRLNVVVVFLAVLGFFAGFYAIVNKSSTLTWMLLLAIAILLWTLAFICQLEWPIREYTIALRTSSGDLQVLTTQNKDYFSKVHAAIKTAFDRRTS